jgi:hypothetical protein
VGIEDRAAARQGCKSVRRRQPGLARGGFVFRRVLQAGL